MDLNLGFLIFGISISFYTFVVQSQIQDGNGAKSQPAFPFYSPPPPPPPPPPQSTSFAYPPPRRSPPPPRAPRRNQAPPKQEHNNENTLRKSPPHHKLHHHPIHSPPPPPPPPPHRMNAGKKVGLLFIGIAAMMQIGMAGFLVFKRKQLLKSNDTYETHA
ncbi:unnamed protein product [Lupinus luteus]|uniref:Uncharacterized protein n=1 Tax=Lupinus luteus TaxID=3873 RepID=A0AAV1WH74_LUPLU